MLTQQNRPPISQYREVSKLVPCVGLSNWFRALRNRIPRKNRRARVRVQLLRPQPHNLRKRVVEHDQFRQADRRGGCSAVKLLRQPGVGIVKAPTGLRKIHRGF